MQTFELEELEALCNVKFPPITLNVSVLSFTYYPSPDFN
jgi:hypothetical protein